MALFKIHKGLIADLEKQPKKEGYAYVAKIDNETAGFYVDYDDNTRLQVGKLYGVVTNSENGLVPKFNAVSGTIDSSSTDWVLTNNNGSLGWYKLPANAFKNDNTNTTYTLSGAASGNTWVTTLTPSSGTATKSTVPAASTTAAGLMTPDMVTKLNGIAAGATANTGDITGVTAGNGLTGGATSGNATLSANLGAGLVFDDNKKIAVNTTYSPAGKNYAVKTDTNGALYVSVPWVNTDTDTHYTTKIFTGASGTAQNDGTATSNPYIKIADAVNGTDTYRNQIQVKGSGATTVKAQSGVITISTPVQNVFTGASASANGTQGLVPQPTKGQEGYYLRGDGVWFNLTGLDESVQNTFGALQKAWKEADTSLKNTLTTLINGKAQTNHASANTTYGVSTDSLYGHAMASGTTPLASAATAAVGSETAKFARGDHVHPLTVANSWSGGVTAGPKLKTTINGVAGTAVAIPKATASVSGVVIVGDQTFGGIKRFSQTDVNATYHLGSFYDYDKGCLIDIGPAKGSTMVAIHITGNSWIDSAVPINSLYQVYDYESGTIMNYSGISIGQDLGAIKVYRYNNRLFAHVKQANTFSTLNITLYTNKIGLTPTVTNAAAPTSGMTDLVTITPSRPPLANSGVTAGNYGPSVGDSLTAVKSFTVPYLTVDDKGRVTAASNKSFSFVTPTSGSWFNNGFVRVGTDGVAEYGRYIDFHVTSASTNDYDVRIDAGTGAKKNTLYLPDVTGQFVTHTNDTATGGADRPIYIAASGAATATTYRMAGTNTTATTALSILEDLPTGIWYVNNTNGVADFAQSDGVCIANQYNSSWISEIYQDYRTGQLAVRGKNNGAWQTWRKILDTINYSATLDTRYVTLTTAQTISGVKTFTAIPQFKTTNYTSTPLAIYDDGTDYGHTLLLGAGGTTYIGAGEAASTLYNTKLKIKSSEHLILGADSNIQFYPGADNATTTNGITLDSSKAFYPQTNNTGSVGTNSYKWNAMYATTFNGDLNGHANSATKIKMASTGIDSTATTDGLLEAGIVRFDTVKATGTTINNDGILLTMGWSATYGAQVWFDDGSSPATMSFRNRNSTSWNPWVRVLTDNNYTQYAADRTAITNITRSGTTFTATRANGTTFTFTQQDNNTTYTAGTGLTLANNQFYVTSANVSTMMNLLGEGTSPAQLDDYLIAQYAGGGTTTTTYHRRKVRNIVNAANVKAALSVTTGTTKYLREDGSWDYIVVPTSQPSSLRAGMMWVTA